MLTDTHSHIYDSAFDEDRPQVVDRALQAGVGIMLLPAIDSSSHGALLDTVRRWPDCCFPMAGLHPTSVNGTAGLAPELDMVERLLRADTDVKFCGVGEIGLDLHWDSRHLGQQIFALRSQLDMALQYGLPVSVHTRDAMPQMIEVLESYRGRGLRGVMHAFCGTAGDAARICSCGDFLFGIGGPVTYKNSSVADFVRQMPLDMIVLETDCPYLPPVPLRGKRNQSAWLTLVRDCVAIIKGAEPEEVEAATTNSARRMFGI